MGAECLVVFPNGKLPERDEIKLNGKSFANDSFVRGVKMIEKGEKNERVIRTVAETENASRIE